MSEGKENEENAQPRKRLPTLGARPRIHSKLARFPRARLHAARPKSGQVTVPLKRTLEQKNDAFAYYSVLYTKRSKKKHKTYQDGFVTLKNDKVVVLKNEDGKDISKATFHGGLGGLKEGNTLEVGTFELEVQGPIKEEDYHSGRVFLPAESVSPQVESTKQFSAGSRKKFKSVGKKASKIVKAGDRKPRHDPKNPNAITIQRSYRNLSGLQTIPIVLDPYIGRHFRPHQREGIKFLYEAVEGMNRAHDGMRGAILADAMGLGKSLQALALIWTVLKQGPLGHPLAKKVLIVCPASLVNNWVAEVNKWLGFERLNPIAIQGGSSTFDTKADVADFYYGNTRRLLIVSYDMFRNQAPSLYKVDIGLVVCDEGHRLKSTAQGNKTIAALSKMPCRRRVILTGTPVQNDLEEFFAMCNFVNPGALGTLKSFRTVFAGPIFASRDTHASPAATILGEARANELFRIASKFVLRRTSETLEKYLPPKYETALFCRLTSYQEELYKEECKVAFNSLTTSRMEGGTALSMITRLRKICNHPSLLQHDEGEQYTANENELDLTCGNVHQSGKLIAVVSMVTTSVAAADRVVIVSNFTRTLDLLGKVLINRGFSFLRLDGSVPSKKRQPLVDRFNSGRSGEDVFLLSSKAGGVGLNLIGANRIILFDLDWNPAVDLQAMARVWRDGQKKSVFVYRLIATGTIEEKMYQRQIFKSELQTAINLHSAGDAGPESTVEGTNLTGSSKNTNFNTEELKELFQYCGGTVEFCDTLEVLARSAYEGTNSNSSLLKSFGEYRTLKENTCQGSTIPIAREDSVLKEVLDCELSKIVSYIYTKRPTVKEERQSVASKISENGQGRPVSKYGYRPLFDTTGESDEEQNESEEKIHDHYAEIVADHEVCNTATVADRPELDKPVLTTLSKMMEPTPTFSLDKDGELVERLPKNEGSSVTNPYHPAKVENCERQKSSERISRVATTKPDNKLSWAAALSELDIDV